MQQQSNKEQQIQVSVIIPVHNGAGTIEKAVDSALGQSVPVHVFVIDDASSDDTKKVLQRYTGDPRFSLITNEKNLGVAKSRMRAVAASDTEYIAFLDSDDWWAEDKLRLQLTAMKEKDAVLSSTGRKLVDQSGKDMGRYIPIPEMIDKKTILRHNCLNCSGVCVRRDVMLEFPMEHDDSHEDYISWIKIISKYGFAIGINKPLLYYRMSESGKSRNKLKSACMNFKVYRYCGFGILRSCICFISYAFNGVKKYYL